jgi:hypothetical protein
LKKKTETKAIGLPVYPAGVSAMFVAQMEKLTVVHGCPVSEKHLLSVQAISAFKTQSK